MPAANPKIADIFELRSLIAAATTAETAIPMVGAIKSSICAVCPQTGWLESWMNDHIWAIAAL
jgi:hypothetical protein